MAARVFIAEHIEAVPGAGRNRDGAFLPCRLHARLQAAAGGSLGVEVVGIAVRVAVRVEIHAVDNGELEAAARSGGPVANDNWNGDEFKAGEPRVLGLL